MFNDRDVGVLGAGAILAVLCLLLPFAFTGKVALGFGVLVGFMILAFLRLGPDRIPPEEWLRRRIRYRLQARRYTYQRAGAVKRHGKSWRVPMPSLAIPWPIPTHGTQSESDKRTPRPRPIPAVRLQPMTMAWDEAAAYPTVLVCLVVLSAYLLAWLAQGGAAEIARVWGGLLR